MLLGQGRESPGVLAATIGLVVALTAGAIVSVYVERIGAITSIHISAALLFAVIHYRSRFPSPAGIAMEEAP